MSIYRANVIVLRTRNLGEADRILVLLSEERGKFEAIVKGARRGRSRFVGNTLPFNFLKAMFFTGKSMDTLSQAELGYSFTGIREDLLKLAYASFWVELVDGFIPERVEAKEIFQFLLAAFLTLEQTPEPMLLNLAFEIRLLNYLGYQPELSLCVGCGKLITGEPCFSSQAGGVLCDRCRAQYSDPVPVKRAVLDLIKQLAAADLRELNKVNGLKDDYKTIGTILLKFMETRLERPLKSKVFLDNLLSLN
jgi:DNA repair protein RecO (recombination protein O)